MSLDIDYDEQKTILEEWRELESDPGLFSLLMEDYGVKGIKVEEVYDIGKKFDGRVYGFVFLFRWTGERRARKKSLVTEDSYVFDSEVVNRMFFANQVVTNSCATHSLLSVLLNLTDVELGPALTKLKNFTAGHDPESKGLAIGNMLELARAHNRHAKPEYAAPQVPSGGKRGSAVVSSAHTLVPETYHFVSYVPINDRLFELDGLKQYPIDHGPWGEHEEWTELFSRIMAEKLSNAQDILYNLMAIVPDPVPKLSERLKTLQSEQKTLLEEAMVLAERLLKEEEQQLKDSYVGETGDSHHAGTCTTAQDILTRVSAALPAEACDLEELVATHTAGSLEEMGVARALRIAVAKVLVNDEKLEVCKKKFHEELELKQQYRVDFCRRRHDYDPLISEFVTMLAENGQLPNRLFERKKSNAHPTKSTAGNKHGRNQGNNRSKKAKTGAVSNGTKVS